ncbi:MgtC/SapB family protein [Williamsia sp. CHRR-6]|uniref:MgtC/SapB family protein n=1 Tax=Williamsia sp. CHRR-6 TaxID=2835871 RepID=UPI001BDB295A|nr:DUF4010 domain-containing protein [Williamsia sp. CHRR-6]MBT0567837.1 MgtC/SapB family protein [Williamsia sp. CHRR-6]
MSWNEIQPFLVAVAIGLLIGVERERSHAGTLPAGSRSFALLALAGAACATVSGAAIVVGLLGAAALAVVAYLRTSRADPGTTTEIALVVTYLLGALAVSRSAIAGALAVIVVGLLVSKSRLHTFVREVITETELEDAIKFFAVVFVVLPLLPDRGLGPYGVLNPAKVWLLVVLLTGIGWVGYLAVRALGPERGLLVSGLAGGFVSASATTATMGRFGRTAANWQAPLSGALMASLATFIQLIAVIGVVSTDVLQRLWPAAAAGALVLAAVAALVYRRGQAAAQSDPSTEPASRARPFALKPALILAVVLTLALLVGRWGADVLGSSGAVLGAFGAGLADAHAGSVAAASLAAQGDISTDTALIAIGAALGSNLLVKSILAFTSGGRRFGAAFVAGMFVPSAVFATALATAIALG